MREYRFRGYDATGQKGWVYGDLAHNQKVTKTGLEPRTMVGGYEVIPESVGINTGLKDANGNDIYEGDYIFTKNGFLGCVKWNSYGYFFIDEELGSEYSKDCAVLGRMLELSPFTLARQKNWERIREFEKIIGNQK